MNSTADLTWRLCVTVSCHVDDSSACNFRNVRRYAGIERRFILSDGKAVFNLRVFNVHLEDLQDLIITEWAMPGLGDADANPSQIIDSGWSTFILSHWHRDTGM